MGTGTQITDARREVVLDSVKAEFERLLAAGGSPATQNTQLAAFMTSKPEFEAAGANTDDGCAWGRFTDGRLLILANNRFPDRSPPAPFVWGKRALKTYVSKSQQARLMHAFGANFSQVQVPITDMANYLRTDGQFTIAPGIEGDARLTALRAVSGDAFFYLNAHGGRGDTKAGTPVYSVGSSTLQNAATDAQAEVKSDFDNNLIVYFEGQTGDVPPRVEKTYGITAAFVNRYMSFSPNAVVFLNVCFSGDSQIPTAQFRNALHNKGAGAVLGWTVSCDARTAFDSARYFVDRMVAANTFEKENPEQRAFGVNAVLADMGRKGKDRDGGSFLKAAYKAGVNDVELRPTIERMIMDEFRDVLVLFGSFGDEPGEVTVNNVPGALVGSWANDILEIRIPLSGVGSEGPVVVKVHGKKSKERTLTSWRSTFSFNLPPPGGRNTLTESATLNVHIRLDVDDIRDEAGGVKKTNPSFIGFACAKDTTFTWATSGESRSITGALEEKWTGGGSPPLVRTAITGPQNAFSCQGAYDPSTKLISFGIQNGGPKTIFRKDTGTHDEMPLGQSAYQKNLDANWVGPVSDMGSGTTIIRWTQLLPTFSPPNNFYRKVGTK